MIFDDQVKLLCFIILVVVQVCSIFAVCLIISIPKWINHRVEGETREKAETRFGKGEVIDENIPIVESVGSSFGK